jgi:hypothetical protein
VARRNRSAVATEQVVDEPRSGGALALEQREDIVDDMPDTGPYDGDDLDPEATDAAGIVDFGAVHVPVPARGTVAVEPTANGRMQAVHVALPEGRLSVSALAAPKSSKLWPELAHEIDTSLREGGATVRSFQGLWGRELHANSGGAKSVFIGVDGPRWMLYGVATGPANHADMLDAELRRMLRATVVVRGKAPYPVRTVLPLVVPEHLAEAMAAAAAAKAEAEAEAAAAAPATPAPSGAAPVPFGAPEPSMQGRVPARPLSEQSGSVRPASPRPRPPAPAPREVAPPAARDYNGYPPPAESEVGIPPAVRDRNGYGPRPDAEVGVPAAARDRNGYAPPPEAEVGAPMWADPVRRIADTEDDSAGGPGTADFDDAPTEIWGPLPPDPTEQAVADRAATGSWRAVREPDPVQESGGHRRAAGPVPGGFPTQPWAFDPRLDDGPQSWAGRAARPDPVRSHALDPAVEDAPTDPWPLADRYRAERMADGPAESPWFPVRDREAHHDGDAVMGTGGRRRAAEAEQPRPGLRAAPEPTDPVPPNGVRRSPGEHHLVETGEYSVPSEYDVRPDYAGPSEYGDSPGYGTPEPGARSEYSGSHGYGERPDHGRPAEYDERPDHAARSGYGGSFEYGERPDHAGRSEYGGASEYGEWPDLAARSEYGGSSEYGERPDHAGRSEYGERPDDAARSGYGGSFEYGERADHTGRSEYGEQPDHAARSEYSRSSEYGERPDHTGRSGYSGSSEYTSRSEYAAPSNGGRRRASEPSDDVVDRPTGGQRRREASPDPLTQQFSYVAGPPAGADPFPVASDETPRPGRGRHYAPDAGDVTPETTPLQVFVPPADPERPTGRHRRPD